jgi:anti-anti-sigma factor
MEITRHQEGRWTVFSLSGDLDPKAARELQKVTRDALSEGQRELVFDLGGVGSLSGPGLRVLLALARRVSQQGSLVLCSLTSEVHSSLQVSDLESQFRIAQSRQEALEVLAEQPQPSELTVAVSEALGVTTSPPESAPSVPGLAEAVEASLCRG